MARRAADVLGVSTTETLIGSGVVVQGPLTGEGDMMIDGDLTGEITTTGDVTVGVNGHIKAPIQALNVTVAGTVRGHITAEGDVTIRETGRVSGNITAGSLSISPGGVFNGRSLVQEHHELERPATETDEEA